MPATPRSLLLLSFLLLSSSLSHSFFFSNYQNLFSLSHSLLSRAATLRAARGDLEGAARAWTLARNLEHGLGLGFYKFAWNVGWDYMKNYAWRDTPSFDTQGGVLSDLNELLAAICELNRIRSDAERLAWIRSDAERLPLGFRSRSSLECSIFSANPDHCGKLWRPCRKKLWRVNY